MLLIELFIVLTAIFVGTRLGGIGIGFTGGLGVLLLALFCQLKPGQIPFDVIQIIMAVIAAIAAMQVAGGMDYLVSLTEKLLRKHPAKITLLAPLVTYSMTLLAGTGHTSFSTLPIIAEVAKESGVRPSRPLSIAVVASQIAITASPISAAVVILAKLVAPHISYLEILAITIPTTFAAVMLTALVTNYLGKELIDDPVYQQRLAKGEITINQKREYRLPPHARLSVLLFLTGIFSVVLYATITSETFTARFNLIPHPPLTRDEAIVTFMLSTAAIITFVCRVDTDKILSSSTFKSGMSACICVMGVAWLGDTFVRAHLDDIKSTASTVLNEYPWMLAVVLFFASTLLYSQAATTKALIPAALALGVSPLTVVASFPAVCALFVLPTYPTLLAAVEMDDTGSTRIGNFVFNHSFILPGTLAITLSVVFAFLFGKVILT